MGVLQDTAATSLDVVIPARDEGPALVACLHALAADAAGLDLRVIVVANGPGREATAAAARSLAPAFAAGGLDLRTVEEEAAGKVRALNRGDAERREGSVLYLDADTLLEPGSLPAIAEALAETDAPRLVAPPRRIAPARRWLTRGFAAVWASLPAVADDVIGSGCYAVTPAGRARWGAFPDVIADDAFVRSCFADGERRVLSQGGSVIVLPEGWGLVGVFRRWRAGNRELRALGEGPDGGRDPRAGLGRNLRHLLARPRLWLSLPAFAVVWMAARLTPHARGGSDWSPVRQPRSTPPSRARM